MKIKYFTLVYLLAESFIKSKTVYLAELSKYSVCRNIRRV